MATLLVLGSKPDPVLPARSQYDDLACANASGASAARHGLMQPAFTVMSAILTSGNKAPNRLALAALAGLGTERLYLYPRPAKGEGSLQQALGAVKHIKTSPAYFRRKMKSLPYRFEQFINPGLDYYHALVRRLCDDDETVCELMARKQPSTGMIALALGLEDGQYDRCILSGFSFEITHAYADNPLIDDRGTARSKHADTDIAFLNCLARKSDRVVTTEAIVSQCSGVPLLDETAAHDGPQASTASR